MKPRFCSFAARLVCCLTALLGLTLSAQTCDDGLQRSTPEAEGIRSDAGHARHHPHGVPDQEHILAPGIIYA
jgi:hypothetical protein